MTMAVEPVAVMTFEPKAYLAAIRTPDRLAYQNELAGAYDQACKELLGPNDVVRADGRVFKTKAAWLKLARHFQISTYLPEDRVRHEMTSDGAFIATVVARAVAPWGQTTENVGACATDEATGRRTITKADAVATAATRALNRAISNLIAMGEVSAEEIGDRTPGAPPGKREATWKGKPLSEYESSELVRLRAWCVKKDAAQFATQIEAIDTILASREGQ